MIFYIFIYKTVFRFTGFYVFFPEIDSYNFEQTFNHLDTLSRREKPRPIFIWNQKIKKICARIETARVT